jgi:hypothetical protein
MRPRFYLAVALLAILAGCAFRFVQTLSVGVGKQAADTCKGEKR